MANNGPTKRQQELIDDAKAKAAALDAALAAAAEVGVVFNPITRRVAVNGATVAHWRMAKPAISFVAAKDRPKAAPLNPGEVALDDIDAEAEG